MSHFFTVVLIPKDTQDIDTKVEELLAPYDENIKVDEYDHKCWCINHEAHQAGRAAAETVIGSFDNLRKTFTAKVQSRLQELNIKHTDENYWEIQDKIAAELNWEEYIKAYSEYEESATKSHPMFNKPNASCDECKGTGLYKSTYNPASKWDWWVIGGRWDGVIQNNYRSSENGFNFGEQHHQLGNNAIPVKEYLKICRESKGQYPYSIVTPIGQWCEKGKMGWFGITADEKDNWKETADQILEKYQDCIAIGCDLHI